MLIASMFEGRLLPRREVPPMEILVTIFLMTVFAYIVKA